MDDDRRAQVPSLPRRTVLVGLAVGAAALVAGCSTGGATEGGAAAERPGGPPADLLLVHGAWHNSACWAEVLPLLAARGHRALAIDLPGHGLTAKFPSSYLAAGQPGFTEEVSPLKDVTLDEAAETVIDGLRRLRDSSGDDPAVVLVGHSVGGIVITRATQLAPELVDHLVYLAAFAPTRLQTGAEYLGLPEQGAPSPGLYIGDPAVIGASRINPRSTDAAYQELLRSVFYGDVPSEEFRSYANGLTPDQPGRLLSGNVDVTPGRWGTVARSYIRTSQDRALLPALQDLMISDADAFTPSNIFRQVTIDSSHSPFASRPEELARTLSDISR